MKYNLNDRRFVTSQNERGLSTTETVFHYLQSGEVITGRYSGGEIIEGNFVGRFISPSQIELRFQCLTKSKELLAGKSVGHISELPNKKLTLDFEWEWLGESIGGGTSRYVEQ